MKQLLADAKVISDADSLGNELDKRLVTQEQVQRIEDAGRDIKSQMERLEGTPGMPTDFFLLTAETFLGAAAAGKPELVREWSHGPQMLKDKFGANRVATVVLHNCPKQYDVFKKMVEKVKQAAGRNRRFHGRGTQVLIRITIVIGPITNLEEYAAAMDLGKTTIDKENRSIDIEVDLSKVTEPVAVKTPPKSPMPPNRPEMGSTKPSDRPSHIRPGRRPQMPQHVPPDVLAKMPPEVRARIEANMSGAIAPEDPNDPGGYKKMVKQMLDSSSVFERRDALESLAAVTPEDVPSQEVRIEIARAFQKIAFDTDISPHDRTKAAEALVTWGGKYSVPLLIKLLDETWVKEAAYKGFAELQDERAIEPVAARFSNFHERREVVACLEAFGPKAEDAVLKLLKTTDSHDIDEVAELLGKIGTKKSLRPLLALLKKKNAIFFKTEVEEAVAAIRQRGK